MAGNLYALFHERFAARAGRAFLAGPDGAAVSFGAMHLWSGRFARVLRERGVVAGDRVLARVAKSPGNVALYLACLRIGAVYVPVNPGCTAAELEFFLEDAGPRALVCDPADTATLGPLAQHAGVEQTLTLDAGGRDGSLDRDAADARPLARIYIRAPDELAAMLYTSGTTGRPKAAMLSHRNLASNALALHACWGWRDGDVLLHALPVFHVHGLFVALHCALLNASTVLFLPRFDVAAVRAALPQATVMMGVPTYYSRLLGDPDFGAADCRGMRLFISGSAPLGVATFEQFAASTGQRILERYGMTECGMIASNPLDGERIAGTVGHALPGVELRITDAAGTTLPAGEVGNVEVRGANVFAAYWREPGQTAAAFRPDGYFITGDLGSLDTQGRLRLAGRATDLIISGGYNVYPKEIEDCLDAVAGVHESAVFGVPDADLGERVVAVIVSAEDDAPVETAVRRALAQTLARYKHPRELHFTAALPRNAMGKVQKQLLRERYARPSQET